MTDLRSHKVGWRTAAIYGIGAVGSAGKSVPMTTFLMLYYNQVVGLPALTVSAVLTLSLMLDAIFDPAIGQLSDNFRSRWGRRLPFMYASALPVSALFVALWLPPAGWSHGALTAYLAACVIGIRLFDTFFDLPHAALIPEMTGDYDERTRLFTLRALFEAAGGMVIMALAYNVFMEQNPDGSGGLLDRQGYPGFAWFTGGLILIALLICTVGLHRRLPPGTVAAPRRLALPGHLREMGATLGSRSFIVLALAAMFIAIESGIGSALNIYWLIYFYEFSQSQMTVLALPVMLGMLIATATPRLTRALGKRNAVIALLWCQGAVTSLPLMARLLDWIPAASPALMVMVGVQSALGAAGMVMILTVLASMMADQVEDAELRTGRRSEGLLLAANSLVRKAMQGLGTLGAGLILTIVDFPQGVERSEMPMQVLLDMGWLVLALGIMFMLLTSATLLLYRSDRTAHEANLAALGMRGGGSRI